MPPRFHKISFYRPSAFAALFLLWSALVPATASNAAEPSDAAAILGQLDKLNSSVDSSNLLSLSKTLAELARRSPSDRLRQRLGEEAENYQKMSNIVEVQRGRCQRKATPQQAKEMVAKGKNPNSECTQPVVISGPHDDLVKASSEAMKSYLPEAEIPESLLKELATEAARAGTAQVTTDFFSVLVNLGGDPKIPGFDPKTGLSRPEDALKSLYGALGVAGKPVAGEAARDPSLQRSLESVWRERVSDPQSPAVLEGALKAAGLGDSPALSKLFSENAKTLGALRKAYLDGDLEKSQRLFDSEVIPLFDGNEDALRELVREKNPVQRFLGVWARYPDNPAMTFAIQSSMADAAAQRLSDANYLAAFKRQVAGAPGDGPERALARPGLVPFTAVGESVNDVPRILRPLVPKQVTAAESARSAAAGVFQNYAKMVASGEVERLKTSDDPGERARYASLRAEAAKQGAVAMRTLSNPDFQFNSLRTQALALPRSDDLARASAILNRLEQQTPEERESAKPDVRVYRAMEAVDGLGTRSTIAQSVTEIGSTPLGNQHVFAGLREGQVMPAYSGMSAQARESFYSGFKDAIRYFDELPQASGGSLLNKLSALLDADPAIQAKLIAKHQNDPRYLDALCSITAHTKNRALFEQKTAKMINDLSIVAVVGIIALQAVGVPSAVAVPALFLTGAPIVAFDTNEALKTNDEISASQVTSQSNGNHARVKQMINKQRVQIAWGAVDTAFLFAVPVKAPTGAGVRLSMEESERAAKLVNGALSDIGQHLTSQFADAKPEVIERVRVLERAAFGQGSKEALDQLKNGALGIDGVTKEMGQAIQSWVTLKESAALKP